MNDADDANADYWTSADREEKKNDEEDKRE